MNYNLDRENIYILKTLDEKLSEFGGSREARKNYLTELQHWNHKEKYCKFN